MNYEKELNELMPYKMTPKMYDYMKKQGKKLYDKVVVIHTQSIAIHEATGKRQKVEFAKEYPFTVLVEVEKMIGKANARTMTGSLQIHLPSVHIRIKRIPRHWTP